jgi:hypothetical protein
MQVIRTVYNISGVTAENALKIIQLSTEHSVSEPLPQGGKLRKT